MLDIDWVLLALCLGGSVAAGLVIFHGIAGYYHYRYYVRRRHEPDSWKIQSSRFLSAKLHRTAVIAATLNLVLAGLLSGVLVYAIARGMRTPIFFDISEYGWFYTIASTIGLFVLIDALAYYVHRMFHIKWLFRRFHRFHHKFVATSPYVATALHPVEMMTLQAASLAPIFIIPLHAASIAIVLVYILAFNIVDHSGVRLSSSMPWQGPSTYHDDHHKYFHVNFGQHLMLFDRFHGTLRRQGRKYGKAVFGGKGKSDKSRGSDLEPFVDYR